MRPKSSCGHFSRGGGRARARAARGARDRGRARRIVSHTCDCDFCFHYLIQASEHLAPEPMGVSFPRSTLNHALRNTNCVPLLPTEMRIFSER